MCARSPVLGARILIYPAVDTQRLLSDWQLPCASHLGETVAADAAAPATGVGALRLVVSFAPISTQATLDECTRAAGTD